MSLAGLSSDSDSDDASAASLDWARDDALYEIAPAAPSHEDATPAELARLAPELDTEAAVLQILKWREQSAPRDSLGNFAVRVSLGMPRYDTVAGRRWPATCARCRERHGELYDPRGPSFFDRVQMPLALAESDEEGIIRDITALRLVMTVCQHNYLTLGQPTRQVALALHRALMKFVWAPSQDLCEDDAELPELPLPTLEHCERYIRENLQSTQARQLIDLRRDNMALLAYRQNQAIECCPGDSVSQLNPRALDEITRLIKTYAEKSRQLQESISLDYIKPMCEILWTLAREGGTRQYLPESWDAGELVHRD